MTIFAFFLLATSPLIHSAITPPRQLPKTPVQEEYDYVVVGCGIAGLVVSSRLSEDGNVSVICVEAGSFDNYEESILIPQFIGDDVGSSFDWDLSTTPQTQLDGAIRSLPLGKVVGGGSVINGMVWNRGNQDDYNAWQTLGNPGWGWSDLLPYFMKSENFTPIYYLDAEHQPVTYIPEAHGRSGPVSVSYPKYYWPQSENWSRALNSLGVPTVYDPDEGNAAGACFLASNIQPDNQTRSDARRAYYDPVSSRKNYNVRSNAHVTRLILDDVQSDTLQHRVGEGGETDGFSDTTITSQSKGIPRSEPATKRQENRDVLLTARGIEYQPDHDAPRRQIFARREVILAAGALHTPQILQRSGIGPAALLNGLNIPVHADLPGVGSNLQDHCLVHASYPYQNPSVITPYECNTNATFNDQAAAEYQASRTGPWTGKPSNSLAFPSLPQILAQIPPDTFRDLNDLLVDIQVNNNSALTYLPQSYSDPSLRLGYQAQLQILIRRLIQPTTPAFEILNNNAGGLTVSLMHPLSRGTVAITTPDTQPAAAAVAAINPNWAAHPLDTKILQAGLEFNEAIVSTPAMQELQPSHNNDDDDSNENNNNNNNSGTTPAHPSPDQLLNRIKRGVQTEFHYSGTAAMMPRPLGGVVDPTLLVYATANVRVVDSSVFPLVPAAHLQAVVYAVAEKAVDLIRREGEGG